MRTHLELEACRPGDNQARPRSMVGWLMPRSRIPFRRYRLFGNKICSWPPFVTNRHSTDIERLHFAATMPLLSEKGQQTLTELTRTPNMIEVESEGNLVTLRMIGAVTSSDWDRVLPKFQEACGQATSVRIRGENRGAIRVLMDWRGLELWEPGARSDCTWFCSGNRDLIGRIAILGSPRWHDEKERLTDIYQKAEVKFFTPAESDSALVWLTGE